MTEFENIAKIKPQTSPFFQSSNPDISWNLGCFICLCPLVVYESMKSMKLKKSILFLQNLSSLPYSSQHNNSSICKPLRYILLYTECIKSNNFHPFCYLQMAYFKSTCSGNKSPLLFLLYVNHQCDLSTYANLYSPFLLSPWGGGVIPKVIVSTFNHTIICEKQNFTLQE